MQAVFAALPELDRLRLDAVAAPVRRPRRVVGIAAARLGHRLFENFPRTNGPALGRGPGREASAERPGGEVRVGLAGCHLFDAALDAHLALELRPEEHQAGRRPRLELAPLAAEVVGIEGESALLRSEER